MPLEGPGTFHSTVMATRARVPDLAGAQMPGLARAGAIRALSITPRQWVVGIAARVADQSTKRAAGSQGADGWTAVLSSGSL